MLTTQLKILSLRANECHDSAKTRVGEGKGDFMTFGYVYITSNDINDLVYVGQSTRLDPENLRTYLGGGDYLRNAMEELGRDHFRKRIVSYHDTREDLDYAELLLIAEMRVAGANLLNGGHGGPRFEWPFMKAMSERFGPPESREGWLTTIRDNPEEVKRGSAARIGDRG